MLATNKKLNQEVKFSLNVVDQADVLNVLIKAEGHEMLRRVSSAKTITLEILFRRSKTHQQSHGPIVTDFQPKKINKKLGK